MLSTCSAPVLGWEQSWRGSESSSLGRRGAPGACRCPRLRWCTHVHTRARTTPIPFRLSSTLSSQSCALSALVPSLTLSLLYSFSPQALPLWVSFGLSSPFSPSLPSFLLTCILPPMGASLSTALPLHLPKAYAQARTLHLLYHISTVTFLCLDMFTSTNAYHCVQVPTVLGTATCCTGS